MSGVGRGARAIVLGLAVLGLAACPAASSKPKGPPPIVDRLEIRVDAPGMSATSVEQLVVVPIELALVGNSDIRGLLCEAREGRARIELSLSRRSELVAVEVLQRLTEIQAQLPDDVEPPVLRPRDPSATTIHFERSGDHGESARAMIEALERTAGVVEVARCGIEQVIMIELDPAALRRLGLDVAEVERVVGSQLRAQPATTIEALLELVVRHVEGSAIMLADLAEVRVEPASGGCRAYSEQGASAGISVTVRGPEARERVDAQLHAAPGVRRFAARLHVWLDPALDREQALALIRGHAGAAYLIEVGVEADPCAGPGSLARLHVPDGAAIEAVAEALAARPGVLLVERPEQPRSRRWLLGPDLEALAGHGGQAGVTIGGEATPELVVELDRQQLAAFGITHADAMTAIRLALAGVEIGRLVDGGVLRPVMLKLGDFEEHELAQLPLSPDGVSLGAVAELRRERSPVRICRRDGERGVAVVDDRSGRRRDGGEGLIPVDRQPFVADDR